MSVILHAFAVGRGQRLGRVSRTGRLVGGGRARGSPPEDVHVNTAGLLACGSTRIRLAFPVVSTSGAAARISLAAYSCGVSSGIAAEATHRIPSFARPVGRRP